MNFAEDPGRYLTFLIEKAFSQQLGKMTMSDMKHDPENMAKLNIILADVSDRFEIPIEVLKRKVSTKFYRQKQIYEANNVASIKKPTSTSGIRKVSAVPLPNARVPTIHREFAKRLKRRMNKCFNKKH